MTAVILAAGVSSRLRPLTDSIPKCLLPVGGFPLLQRTLDVLAGFPIHRVVIVVGYRHEQIRAFVATLHLPFPVVFALNDRFASTGNNYSLWLAAPECTGQPILLLDSDILFHPDVVARLLAAPYDSALALRESSSLGEEEIKVTAAADGQVTRIGKDILPALAVGESLGIERFSSGAATRLFGILDRRKDLNEFYEASFQEMIDQGVSVHAVSCGSFPCIEIDTPDDLRAADLLAAKLPP